jgi:hypothetical protein
LTLKAYSFFHLNLAYSAIEEVRRPEVIEKCYWPLLRLARKFNLPFGIEASAWTLEAINEIDPHWVHELKELVTCGPCEFIGSGYTQIIGPLVPADVNVANLRIGMSRYEALLGLKPQIALVNEQAYSAGLVPLYREAGFKAIIMEWDNPARGNPDWPAEWRYHPQFAVGADGHPFPVIWNKSVSFQKLQRFVHGELELDEYLRYVDSHQGDRLRAFPIYGNDVEVFDFRPGRYMTEAPIEAESEWARLESIYAALTQTPHVELILPSRVLDLMDSEGAGNHLRLESAENPIPVKKQDKYNITRWALTGRNDLEINTQCLRVFEHLQKSGCTDESEWCALCELWSSDYRTHITEHRWRDYICRLEGASLRKGSIRIPTFSKDFENDTHSAKRGPPGLLQVKRERNFLKLEGARLTVWLNCLRGLAVERFIDRKHSDRSLFGTLPHGYFDDIRWAADFYTGHFTYESPGKPKVTDLSRVEPGVDSCNEKVDVYAVFKTPFGDVKKTWSIDDTQGTVTLNYEFIWSGPILGSLRLGYITLLPGTFDYGDLGFACAMGGRELEFMKLGRLDFDHGDPVSSLISARQTLPITTGFLSLGDKRTAVEMHVNRLESAATAMLSTRSIGDKFLTRAYFSLIETDDTSKPIDNFRRIFQLKIGVSNQRQI